MAGIAGTVWKKEYRPQEEEPAFLYLTNDSVVLDIYETYDLSGVLDGYRTHVLSPVCEDRLRYDAFFAARIGEKLSPELFSRASIQDFFRKHIHRLE